MRFRTDGWHYADLKAQGWIWEGKGEKSYGQYNGSEEGKKIWDETPPAEKGDVWRVLWSGDSGNIAGYAICCVACGKLHSWLSAGNCQYKVEEKSWTDEKGQVHTYKVCGHSGLSSCWEWSGSAEEGTLTAKPSLQVTEYETTPGGCNWHGYITNGDIHT